MFKIILFILPICVFQCVFTQNLIVNTKQGQVKGVEAADGDYSMFLGIPYAKIEDTNPFGPSIPHPKFEEIFEANDDSHICPQVEEFNHTIVGELDCLRLNVFVPPTANATNKLPVLVWIYGGGFTIGFYGRYLYGPKFLVKQDIILVTINYRIGPYGFMCLDTPEVSGNQGLKDQLLALRWLNENIEAFGGDPDKITVSGNSAGSMSIEYLLMHKNQSPKLIDKAILQSGSVFTVSHGQPLLDAPLLISDYLGFSTSDRTQALSFLATADPLLVIQAVQALGIISKFGPCIETKYNGVEAILTEHPVTTTFLPVKDMPIMIGFNNDEGYGLAVPMVNYNVTNVLTSKFNTSDEDFVGMADIMQHFYFGDEALDEKAVRSAADLFGDATFIYPIIKSLKRFIVSEAEMYFYMFSYVGGRNFVKHRENVVDDSGAWHADEVGYLFDISYMEEPTPEDQLIIDRMTTLWANFVKNGDPTPAPSELLPQKWQPITKGSPRHFLKIDWPLTTDFSPYNKRMAFWDLFYEANGHLQL